MQNKKIELITIGNEYLVGGKPVATSDFFGKHFNELGLCLSRRTVLPCDIDVCVDELKAVVGRSDYVLVIGTVAHLADFCSDVIAKAFDIEKVADNEAHEHIHHQYKKRGHKMSHTLSNSITKPSGAKTIIYSNAPHYGWILKHDDKVVGVLPGDIDDVSAQWELMTEKKELLQHLKTIKSSRIGYVGVTFDTVERTARHLQERFPNVDIEATESVIDNQIRVTASSDKVEDPDAAVAEVVALARQSKTTGKYIFGVDKSLASATVELLRLKGETVSLAESCTGGLVAKMITDVPGSSNVFPGSYVTYSAGTKMSMVGVHSTTIAEHTVISSSVASEMAKGARRELGTTYGVSITGLAGPEPDDSGKEVGTVYVCVSISGKNNTFKYNIIGNRDTIRLRAAKYALRELYLAAKKSLAD